jgi:RimJ/RimL family protein N-acetyltransferase
VVLPLSGSYGVRMAQVTVTGGSGRWEAYDGGQRIGVLRAATRPDRRIHVTFQDCRDDAYAPLLAHARTDLTGDLHTSVDERDYAGLRQLGDLGFTLLRIEHRYRVPVDPPRLRLRAVAAPTGIDLISAANADLDRLRVLDDALRHEVPGSGGWRWSPEEFREETFSDGFDPETYRVAVERDTGRYVGLMRLWMKPAGPRFGLIGVLPSWRRTRVTYALLSTVLAEVHRRGWRDAEAEIDATNRASNAIAARAGAVRMGGSCVLVRRVAAGQDGSIGSSSSSSGAR